MLGVALECDIQLGASGQEREGQARVPHALKHVPRVLVVHAAVCKEGRREDDRGRALAVADG